MVQHFQENPLIMEFHVADPFGEDLDASAGELAIAKGADGALLDGMGIADEAFPRVAFELVQ
jgi:hypothetical protein